MQCHRSVDSVLNLVEWVVGRDECDGFGENSTPAVRGWFTFQRNLPGGEEVK